MHLVSKVDPASAKTPQAYQAKSSGFRRFNYVDRAAGSVHMGTGICYLDPGGFIEPHVHSFEESFYILEGSMVVQVGDDAYSLGAGHYGLISTGIKHAFRNTSDQPVRWLEMQAPQPRDPDYGRDTFFVDGAAPDKASGSDSPLIGFFDEEQLPRPGGPSQMEGFNPTTGVAIKMFVDRSFGSVHQSLFLIQYQPGAKIDMHDHTFEESYYIVNGRIQAIADGQTYELGPGDAIWTSVGCLHTFDNSSDESVRWIETQAPLPPSKEVFRFEKDWQQYS